MSTSEHRRGTIFTRLGIPAVLLLVFAGALPRHAATDPHADPTQSCADCHNLHYSRSHNLDGSEPPTPLTPGGPFTYLLDNDVSTYITASVYSGATLANATTARLASGLTVTVDTTPQYAKTIFGRLAVAITPPQGISVLNDKGMPLTRLTHFVTDAGGVRRPGTPIDVALRQDCAIFVIDAQTDVVDVLDLRGRVTHQLWGADALRVDRRTVHPRCVAIDSFDNVYLALGGDESAIVTYTPALAPLRVIGRMTGGALNEITDLTVDGTGKIAATYGAAQTVRVYAATGALLDTSSTRANALDAPARLR